MKIGYRLVGIDGIIVKTPAQLKEELLCAVAKKDIGIILIAENLSRQYPELIKEIKLKQKLPLLVEVMGMCDF